MMWKSQKKIGVGCSEAGKGPYGPYKMVREVIKKQANCHQPSLLITPITPYHTYHFSILTSLTFITSKLPSQDNFHHLITKGPKGSFF